MEDWNKYGELVLMKFRGRQEASRLVKKDGVASLVQGRPEWVRAMVEYDY